MTRWISLLLLALAGASTSSPFQAVPAPPPPARIGEGLPGAHRLPTARLRGPADARHGGSGARERSAAATPRPPKAPGIAPESQPIARAVRPPASGSRATPEVPGLAGEPYIHDPSTVMVEDGKYYVWGTGAGLPGLVSDDGWSWRRGASLMDAVHGDRAEVLRRGGRNTWAPDVIREGARYFVYYAAPGTQPKSAIGLLVGTTLDPQAPGYGWEDGGAVVWSDGEEDSNAIDPGVFRDPTNGSLWLTYGSYFGYIRLVELDPKTGRRLHPDRKPVDIAINGEASDMIYHDGWYYLLLDHGSCCAGAASTYNIRVGRSRKVTGPFVDNMGIDMLQGGGKLFVGSEGRFIGAGHFGLLDLGDGVQKFSLHFEAALDRGGRSVLDIRPLLWRDGWPVAGENFAAGTYEIQSARTGTSLEMAVEGVPVGGPRRRGFGGAPGAPGAAGAPGGEPAAIPDQDAAQVDGRWPAGPVAARLSQYLVQAQQKWDVTPVPDAGGYPGSPYFRITIAGTGRALAATADSELVVVPAFTGAPEQLWRIDRLADGTYRVMPKAVPGSGVPLALSAIGSSMPTLGRFDPAGDRQRWLFRAP